MDLRSRARVNDARAPVEVNAAAEDRFGERIMSIGRTSAIRPRALAALAVVLAFAIVGCGSGSPGMVPVAAVAGIVPAAVVPGAEPSASAPTPDPLPGKIGLEKNDDPAALRLNFVVLELSGGEFSGGVDPLNGFDQRLLSSDANPEVARAQIRNGIPRRVRHENIEDDPFDGDEVLSSDLLRHSRAGAQLKREKKGHKPEPDHAVYNPSHTREARHRRKTPCSNNARQQPPSRDRHLTKGTIQ